MKSFARRLKEDLLRLFAEYSAPKFMAQDRRYRKYAIGDFTYGDPVIMRWDDSTHLRIGKYCSIANGVVILLGGGHRIDWVTTYPLAVFSKELANCRGHPCTKGDIDIGHDVWIGFGATIMSGTRIGSGSVIAANSTVTHDVPPYAIVAGSPARVINYRFDPETIKRLIAIGWWNWDHATVVERGRNLLSDDLAAFMRCFESAGQE